MVYNLFINLLYLLYIVVILVLLYYIANGLYINNNEFYWYNKALNTRDIGYNITESKTA